jgi:hypothetical protein
MAPLLEIAILKLLTTAQAYAVNMNYESVWYGLVTKTLCVLWSS